MRTKHTRLGKDAVLWEQGDVARDLAVVERGRLGIRTDGGIVGIALPRMVVGESALLEGGGIPERRSATVFAMEDDTEVVSYPTDAVRGLLEGGDDAVAHQALHTLLGQICRNLLMAVSARREEPLVDVPLMGLVRGLAGDAGRLGKFTTWDRFQHAFTLLYELRDLSDRLLGRLGPEPSQRLEMIENASQALGQIGEGVDVLPLVESYLQAERAKTEWWART
jgi:CRP-like cAMP-binding protein